MYNTTLICPHSFSRLPLRDRGVSQLAYQAVINIKVSVRTLGNLFGLEKEKSPGYDVILKKSQFRGYGGFHK